MADEEKKKLTPEEISRMNELLDESLRRQEYLTDATKDYLQKVKEIGDATEAINRVKKEIARLTDSEGNALSHLSDEEKKRLEILKQAVALKETELEAQKKLLSEVNKWAAAMHLGNKALSKTSQLIKNGFGALRSSGIFEMDKEIRNAARSMNVGSKNFQRMANQIGSAAEKTTLWGVGVKQLAIMQREYSEEIGRSVRLSEEGLEALALISEGTGLGDNFAVGLAAEMDKFGMSVKGTRDVVQETVDIAAKMGVNSAAASKTLQKSLSLAQRFAFKGGVKGLTTMANKAERLRLDMDGIAGVAEKVFRPEGAIEMAALLTTIGGRFSALGDPMQLMFKARNDFEGFAEDIGKATAEFVEFNEATGSFDIKGGLAADRMREIANITGLSVEKMQEMAVQQKKIEQFGSMVPITFNKEDTEMLASLAEWDADKKEFVINSGDFTSSLKDLQAGDLKRIRDEKQTLKERAEQARTFQENWEDIILQFQQLLLPMAQGLKDGLGGLITTMNDTFVKGDAYKWAKELVVMAGSLTKNVAKVGATLLNWSNKTFGEKGTLVGALSVIFGGKILWNAAKWFANGVSLSKGFLFGTKGSQAITGGLGMTKGAGLLGKGLTKGGFAGGLGLGAVGLGADIIRNRMSEEKQNSIGGQALGVGASALKYAGIGTMLLGGPWGTAIGGLLGTGVGLYQEHQKRQQRESVGINDGVVNLNPQKLQKQSRIQFNPKDKFIQLDDTLIAGTNEGGNRELAKSMKESKSRDGIVKHVFEDFNFNINIAFKGNEELGSELAKDQAFVRRINEAIQEQISAALGGGKISPNPKFA